MQSFVWASTEEFIRDYGNFLDFSDKVVHAKLDESGNLLLTLTELEKENWISPLQPYFETFKATDGVEISADCSTIVGGVSGALSASPAGAVIQGVGNAAINVGESLLESLLANDFSDLSIQGLFVDATTGMILGYIGGDGLLRKNDKLAAAVNLYDETMARELRRENKEYAQKKMADVMIYYTDTRAEALGKFTFETLIGTGAELAVDYTTTNNENRIARGK